MAVEKAIAAGGLIKSLHISKAAPNRLARACAPQKGGSSEPIILELGARVSRMYATGRENVKGHPR